MTVKVPYHTKLSAITLPLIEVTAVGKDYREYIVGRPEISIHVDTSLS